MKSPTRRSNEGAIAPMLRASLKDSGAGATRTAPGSRCGSQTIGAVSARRSGSIAKRKSPSNPQRLRELGLAGSIAGGCPIVALVVGIAAQELPRQFSRIEIFEVGVGGRRPPIGYWRHIGPRNMRYAYTVTLTEQCPAEYRVACNCGRMQPSGAAPATFLRCRFAFAGTRPL